MSKRDDANQPSLTGAVLVCHRHGSASGVEETETEVSSLEELYAACLAVEAPTLIDHVLIRGVDAEGEPRVVAFGFHSLTTGES